MIVWPLWAAPLELRGRIPQQLPRLPRAHQASSLPHTSQFQEPFLFFRMQKQAPIRQCQQLPLWHSGVFPTGEPWARSFFWRAHKPKEWAPTRIRRVISSSTLSDLPLPVEQEVTQTLEASGRKNNQPTKTQTQARDTMLYIQFSWERRKTNIQDQC